MRFSRKQALRRIAGATVALGGTVYIVIVKSFV